MGLKIPTGNSIADLVIIGFSVILYSLGWLCAGIYLGEEGYFNGKRRENQNRIGGKEKCFPQQ